MTTMATGATPRPGKQLLQASRPFQEEERARTWFHFVTTSLALVSAHALTFYAPWLPLKLCGSVLIALILVRFGIFFHDTFHDAIFRKSRVGRALMHLYGYYVCMCPSMWKQGHDLHHQRNGLLPQWEGGYYPMLSTDQWQELPEARRSEYKLKRHWFFFVLYLPVLFIFTLVGFAANPRRYPDALATAGMVVVTNVATAYFLGFEVMLLQILGPNCLVAALMAYVFYSQHNAPGVKAWRSEETWDFFESAIHGCTMMEMSPVMHWFTGNIGYHGVHHLNHRIPFYRLTEAWAALPEFEQSPRTSWRIGDVAAALRMQLFRSDGGEMVPFEEAATLPQPGAPTGPA